jgi:toxin ParE1/3/4
LILKLHRRAEAEVREAALWYAGQGENLDRRFLLAVREAFESLEGNPLQFAKLETAASGALFRRLLLHNFPYVVVYELFEQEVFVCAVAHASRRPNYWRRRKRGSS